MRPATPGKGIRQTGIGPGRRHGRGKMAHSMLGWSGDDLGLFTDLYELTMAQVFFEQGMFSTATFSLFIRNHPPNRGYMVFAGLEDVLEYLEGLSFDGEKVEYLRSRRASFPKSSWNTWRGCGSLGVCGPWRRGGCSSPTSRCWRLQGR